MYTIEQKYEALKRVSDATIDAIAENTDDATFSKIAMRMGEIAREKAVDKDLTFEVMLELQRDVEQQYLDELNAEKQGYPSVN